MPVSYTHLPKLTELCEFFDIYPYDVSRASIALFGAAPSAHDARYDTAALYLAVEEGMRRHTEMQEAMSCAK